VSQLKLAVSGDLQEYTATLAKAVETGCNRAIRRVTFGLRSNLRGRVRRAGFRSPGLSKALAAKVDRSKLEGRVYSVARYEASEGRQAFDLIKLFEEGATITAAKGKFLAVPTGLGPMRGGRGGQRRATPQEVSDMGWKLAVLPSRGGRMVVLATLPSGVKIVTHVLIPQNKLRKRYDLQSGITLWEDRMSQVLAEEIDKASEKKGV